MENKKEYCALCGKEINQGNWGVVMAIKVFCAKDCSTKIFTEYLLNFRKTVDKQK